MSSIFESMRTEMIDSAVDTFSNFDKYLNGTYQLLTTDVFSGNWATISNAIAMVVKPTAATICGICFLIQFLKITLNMDVVKWEFLVKVFGQFCIAKASIDVSSDALKLVFYTVSRWVTKVGTGTVSVGSQLATSAQTTLNECDFGKVLAIWLSSSIFVMFLKLLGMTIKVMGYAATFELTCINSIAPLPFAFLCLDDGAGQGSRVFKNFAFYYIGICLKPLFMIISITAFTTLASGISLSNWTEGLSDLLILSMVLAMALIKSEQWATRVLSA